MQLLYSVRWQSSDGNVAQQPPHPPPSAGWSHGVPPSCRPGYKGFEETTRY